MVVKNLILALKKAMHHGGHGAAALHGGKAKKGN